VPVCTLALMHPQGGGQRSSGGGSGGRVWLDVPYAEKDQAKQLGARWDPSARRWYAGPAATAELLTRWVAAPPIPAVLPGEDRGFGTGLFVDLIPAGCWFTQIRTAVSQTDWERLRRMLAQRAGGRCEICAAGPDPALGRRMEAHERFAYDEATGTQVLTRLLWICSDCHQATHFGLAEVRGQRERALGHLRTVTGMNPAQAEAHIAAAFAVWRARSDRYWRLDLAILERAGITVTPPPPPAERAAIAEDHLARLHPTGAAGGDGWDYGDVEEQDADELNAFYAAHGLGGDSAADEGCGGLSIRAVSAEDAPAYLEALLHGREPFPPPAPPADQGASRTADGGRTTSAAVRRRWWSRRR
jgi:hypothetical protein